ncbi:helix-turn-helix domain-containing protein [Hungatella hathewayi]|uniref:helix-turn-helix domain-containing protein n=1 Tax=Hungatella hathewayi TaxID=154046 RepID=UPI002045F40B|nr:MAG TPA: helix-turn-helix domain protein [Bacteriophage sp.]
MKYERLEDLREDHDWKQTYVAHCLNIGQRTYSHYENGTRSIPIEMLSALADLYGTSVDYLIERTDVKEPYPKGKKS